LSTKKFNVAMVGLGFGAEFIPIYQKHPQSNVVAICQRTESKLNEVGDALGIEKRYTRFEEVLADSEVDFVHINSPIPDHAQMSIAALSAGKHVLCTVPMATTIEECRQIVDLVKKTGLKYMMAETVVYSREFLFVQENDDLAKKSGSQFAVESCHIKIKDSDVGAHIWRFLFDTARQYRESIDVYGTKKSFEWQLIEGEDPVLHTAKKPESEIAQRVKVPDFAHLLPEEIRPFTQTIEDAEHLSFVQGGGHGGSHPHMVHEFLSALAEDRDPWPNAAESANWTCVGICAHESALQGGEIVRLPEFTLV